jgi:hypothetical protein
LPTPKTALAWSAAAAGEARQLAAPKPPAKAGRRFASARETPAAKDRTPGPSESAVAAALCRRTPKV